MHICSKGSGNFVFLGTLRLPPVNHARKWSQMGESPSLRHGPCGSQLGISLQMINFLWAELKFKWSSTGKWGEEKYYVSAVRLEGILLLCPTADLVMAKLHWLQTTLLSTDVHDPQGLGKGNSITVWDPLVMKSCLQNHCWQFDLLWWPVSQERQLNGWICDFGLWRFITGASSHGCLMFY